MAAAPPELSLYRPAAVSDSRRNPLVNAGRRIPDRLESFAGLAQIAAALKLLPITVRVLEERLLADRAETARGPDIEDDAGGSNLAVGAVECHKFPFLLSMYS